MGRCSDSDLNVINQPTTAIKVRTFSRIEGTLESSLNILRGERAAFKINSKEKKNVSH